MKKMYENIYMHIAEARDEAIFRNIRANSIILDRDLAYCQGLIGFKPMIMGLKVNYIKNLANEYGYNFVIFEDNSESIEPVKTLSDYSTDELLNEIKRRMEGHEN